MAVRIACSSIRGLTAVRGCPVKLLTPKSLLRISSSSTTLPQDQKRFSSNVSVTNKGNGVAVLTMNKKPVNSMGLEFLTDLVIALEKIENDKQNKAVIVTSDVPGIFCAGLDFQELYKPSRDRLKEFWRAVQEFWLRFYGADLCVFAAINGHALAGGCALALTADYRIMVDGPYKTGLNETQMGIVAPFWFEDTMLNTIGHRETEKALLLGKTFGVQDALQVGLIDEVCPANELMIVAEERIQPWLKIPAFALQVNKHRLRRHTLEKLLMRREEDADLFADQIMKDSIQRSLGIYLESLKKSSEKK